MTEKKREVYERQKGVFPACEQHFEIEETEADHITLLSKGGAEKLLPKTARLFAKTAIGEKVGFNYLLIIFKIVSKLSLSPAPSFLVMNPLSGSEKAIVAPTVIILSFSSESFIVL